MIILFPLALQLQRRTPVEVQEAALEEVFAGGLGLVGAGFGEAGARLVVFRDGGLAVFVLGLGQDEGVLGGRGGFGGGAVLGFRRKGVRMGLLDFLIQALFRLVQGDLLQRPVQPWISLYRLCFALSRVICWSVRFSRAVRTLFRAEKRSKMGTLSESPTYGLKLCESCCQKPSCG